MYFVIFHEPQDLDQEQDQDQDLDQNQELDQDLDVALGLDADHSFPFNIIIFDSRVIHDQKQ